MLQKILIILKIALNESCVELNFLRKTQWKYVSIYSRSGDKGLQRLGIVIYQKFFFKKNSTTS